MGGWKMNGWMDGQKMEGYMGGCAGGRRDG